METLDFSSYIVCYNFVIGVLIALSSEKLGAYAGNLNRGRRDGLERYTRLTAMTFGCAVAILSAFTYIAFHVLRIGV